MGEAMLGLRWVAAACGGRGGDHARGCLRAPPSACGISPQRGEKKLGRRGISPWRREKFWGRGVSPRRRGAIWVEAGWGGELARGPPLSRCDISPRKRGEKIEGAAAPSGGGAEKIWARHFLSHAGGGHFGVSSGGRGMLVGFGIRLIRQDVGAAERRSCGGEAG